MTEAVARIVRRSNAAVLTEGVDRLETARQAAGQVGYGARVVALDQPLDGEKGPPLLLALESDAAPPSIGAALPGATGYLINGVSQRALSRPHRHAAGSPRGGADRAAVGAAHCRAR